ISKSTLKAPFDGIVAAQNLDEGVVVAAGQSVVRLMEAAPEARIGLPVEAASRLEAGNSLSVILGGDRTPATVASVLPEVDPDTRTQTVVLQLDPAALPRLNPGQTARVELTETVAAEGYWLPTEALTQDVRGLWSAFAVIPGEVASGEREGAYQVQPKSVEILHEESDGDGPRALVRGTIAPGDRIVASGVHRLVPGQRVQPL
ncbi:MAG: HlyD family efflux transporter periplasmic adaptor subunit, partial [Cyanobacteria bacterium P01_A01_bin.135]